METTTITAEEIMTRRLVVTAPDTHVIDAIGQLILNRVSGLPVVDSGSRFVGRFSERCAISALDLSSLHLDSRIAGILRVVKAADLMDRSGMVLRGVLRTT